MQTYLVIPKKSCTGSGACWVYIKVWFNRFMYGMYPNTEQWRINLSFAVVLVLLVLVFLCLENIKNI